MAEKLKKTVYIYDVLQYVFIAAYIVAIVNPHPMPLWFFVIVPLVASLLFIFYKDFTKNQVVTFWIFRIGMIVYSFSLTNMIFKMIEEEYNTKVFIGVKGIVYITVMTFAFFLLFYDNKKKEESLKNLQVKENLSAKNKNKSENKKKNYDVVLCKDAESKKDVIWKSLDRFLHMLIIGPTGCGKTSQILIPMAVQDIREGRGVTVIEPKGDFAEKIYAMGKKFGRNVIYFNPIYPDCPYYNPLDGKEDEVIETMTTTFNMLTPDSKTYFQDLSNNLIRKSLMVIKRIEAAYYNPDTGISERPATMIVLSDLIHNTEGRGKKMVNELCNIPTLDESEKKQNIDTRDWFLNEYFSDRSKVYENTSGIRTQVSNLIQNKYLRRVLNPANGKSELNFDEQLANGGALAISTAQGTLRELGSYLGYFIIFSFQSAVFRRPGNEFNRTPNFLYIDEFQKYSNPGFSDILTQGRSYRVSSILATQSRKQITMGSGKDGNAFLEVVNANARNLVIFPGISPEDAAFYSKAFGEYEKVDVRKGESKQKFSFAYGLQDMRYPTESTQYVNVKEANYSESDITYKKFSEITYRLIDDSSVQKAKDGIAAWIPKDLNEELNQIVENYIEIQTKANEIAEREIEERRMAMNREFLKRKTGTNNEKNNESGTGTGGLGAGAVNQNVDTDSANDDRLKNKGKKVVAGKGTTPTPQPKPQPQPIVQEKKDEETMEDDQTFDFGDENFNDIPIE